MQFKCSFIKVIYLRICEYNISGTQMAQQLWNQTSSLTTTKKKKVFI